VDVWVGCGCGSLSGYGVKWVWGWGWGGVEKIYSGVKALVIHTLRQYTHMHTHIGCSGEGKRRPSGHTGPVGCFKRKCGGVCARGEAKRVAAAATAAGSLDRCVCVCACACAFVSVFVCVCVCVCA